jgi:hypothetical protein
MYLDPKSHSFYINSIPSTGTVSLGILCSYNDLGQTELFKSIPLTISASGNTTVIPVNTNITKRVLYSFSLFNYANASNLVSVNIADNTTGLSTVIYKLNLPSNYSLQYTTNNGWFITPFITDGGSP